MLTVLTRRSADTFQPFSPQKTEGVVMASPAIGVAKPALTQDVFQAANRSGVIPVERIVQLTKHFRDITGTNTQKPASSLIVPEIIVVTNFLEQQYLEKLLPFFTGLHRSLIEGLKKAEPISEAGDLAHNPKQLIARLEQCLELRQDKENLLALIPTDIYPLIAAHEGIYSPLAHFDLKNPHKTIPTIIEILDRLLPAVKPLSTSTRDWANRTKIFDGPYA